MIKDICKIPAANIIIKGQNLRTFPLRSGIRQGFPLLPLLVNLILEVLTRTIGQWREIKCIQAWNKEVNLYLFMDNMILQVENTNEYITTGTKKNQQIHNFKIHTQNSVVSV